MFFFMVFLRLWSFVSPSTYSVNSVTFQWTQWFFKWPFCIYNIHVFKWRVFLLSNYYCDNWKIYLFRFSMATIARKTKTFVKIMLFINPSYLWKSGVEQMKTTREKLSQTFIFCSHTLAKQLIYIKCFLESFFHQLSSYSWMYLICRLTCFIFLEFYWWSFWIFRPQMKLLKNLKLGKKIRKCFAAYQKMLRYFMASFSIHA